MIRRMSFLSILLAVVLFAVPSFGEDVYLYDNSISRAVNIGKYTTEGVVEFLTGIGENCGTDPGPAPAPYPPITLWEPGYEQLGVSNVEMDGVWFINVGNHWVKDRLALVLWKIRIPNANGRMASEFAQDLTLSMWVDWDESEMWDNDEVTLRKHLNINPWLPTDQQTLCIYYLTGFRVPDIFDMGSSRAAWKDWGEEVKKLWVRCTIAYDDPDVSPDGNQLFGEAEDYRIGYMLTGKQKDEQ